MPNDDKLDLNDLYLMIGQREVEKYKLRWQLGQLEEQVKQLTKERDDANSIIAGNGSEPQPKTEAKAPVETVAD